MKKKAVALLMITASVVTAAGCGKSKEQQAAETLYKAWGMSDEEAEGMADDLYGEQGVFTEAAKQAEEETKEEEVGTVWEMDPVVADGFDQGLYQVNDMVFRCDGTMTADEAIAVVKNSSEGDQYEYEYWPDAEKTVRQAVDVEFEKGENNLYKERFVLIFEHPERNMDVLDNVEDAEPLPTKDLVLTAIFGPTSGSLDEKETRMRFWLPGGFEITNPEMTRDELIAYCQDNGFIENDGPVYNGTWDVKNRYWTEDESWNVTVECATPTDLDGKVTFFETKVCFDKDQKIEGYGISTTRGGFGQVSPDAHAAKEEAAEQAEEAE